jgi:predicted acetyltransferase
VRSFTSWFHGATVPTAGLAGVTVAAERRGEGALRPLMTTALDDARERGAVVSTLYPSSAGIYRGLGYEVVGSYEDVRVPLGALAGVRAPDGVRTRRATAGDMDAIHDVYRSWAEAQNGPLTRAEEPFTMTANEMVGTGSDYTGVSVAVSTDPHSEGRVVGFASWTRGNGDDRAHTITVDDLVALTPDAARALWRVLGSFAPVAGFVKVATSGGWSGADVARLVLPDHVASAESRPYMLRILDVPGALRAARLAPITARVPFAVVDPRTPDLEGAWTLDVSDGAVRVVPSSAGCRAGEDGLTFTSAGLAQSYTGAQSCGNLRLAGQLAGPRDHDALWDALWGGRQVHVRDYF